MRFLTIFLVAIPGYAIAQLVTISVPSIAVTRSNIPITFSSSGYDAPRLSGLDDDDVRLVVEQGTLTLASVEDLVFSIGDGDTDSVMEFTGPEDRVNAAFDGLIYSPPIGFAGRTTITMSAGATTTQWYITVNAPIDADGARDAILNGVQSIHGGD